MCNRCGCQNFGYEEELNNYGCNNYNSRNMRQLACAAERFVREENREMRCCERRCESQYQNCTRRCNRNCF